MPELSAGSFDIASESSSHGSVDTTLSQALCEIRNTCSCCGVISLFNFIYRYQVNVAVYPSEEIRQPVRILIR